MSQEAVLEGCTAPPAELYATFDAKYGVFLVHLSRADAEHERRRDPAYIRILIYKPASP